MRRMGSYLMWVAIAATCVTSSMFLTALAPNLLAVELVQEDREDRVRVDGLVYVRSRPSAFCCSRWSRCWPTGSIRPR